jgi:AraC-like DNA-binding protein
MPSFQMTPLLASDGLSLRRVVCDGVDCSRPAEERSDTARVVTLLHGRFAFRDAATRAMASPAVALRLRGGHDYRVSHPDGGDVCLCLQGTLARALVDDGPTASPISAAGYVALQRLASKLGAGEPATPLEVEDTMCTALAVDATPRPMRPRDRDAATTMAYYLDRDLDSRLSLLDVARTAGISAFHASRVFRRTTGFSIHGYLRESRLRHALALVLDTDRPIAQIAVDLGFANQGHLTNLFRRRFRTTPARARRHYNLACL